jgi:ABC-2 type transport system ATP-binding protein
MEEAENCDRIAVIDHGSIVALDTPSGLKSSVGGDLISLSTADPASAAAELRERFGISAVVRDGNVTFKVRAGEAFLPEFVRDFEQPVKAIGLRRPTLDDVFLHLMGREIREEASGRGALAG